MYQFRYIVTVVIIYFSCYFIKRNCESLCCTTVGAYQTIIGDSKISRIGLIQGLTEGCLQTFVFLWSPALRAFSVHAVSGVFGYDKNGDPAYGLIFGAFMFCGVLGGLAEPTVHKAFSQLTSSKVKQVTATGEEEVNHSDVDCLCASCYILSACLLLTPCLVDKNSPYAFSICLCAFLSYELLVGVYMPCEGVIRSIYMPNESICSLMTMLRVIVNICVALGVISTNYVCFTKAFSALSVLMIIAAILQLSLIPKNQQDRLLPNFLKGMSSTKSIKCRIDTIPALGESEISLDCNALGKSEISLDCKKNM